MEDMWNVYFFLCLAGITNELVELGISCLNFWYALKITNVGVCVKRLYFTNLLWWEIVIVEVRTVVAKVVELRVCLRNCCGDPCFIPEQSLWYWCTNRCWDGVCLECFSFPCQCHNTSAPHSSIHLSLMLLTSLNNALFKLWKVCTVVDH